MAADRIVCGDVALTNIVFQGYNHHPSGVFVSLPFGSGSVVIDATKKSRRCFAFFGDGLSFDVLHP